MPLPRDVKKALIAYRDEMKEAGHKLPVKVELPMELFAWVVDLIAPTFNTTGKQMLDSLLSGSNGPLNAYGVTILLKLGSSAA